MASDLEVPRHPHQQLWRLLDGKSRRRVIILIGLMLFGVVLETAGIGMVVPMIAILTQEDIGASFPVVQPLLDQLGNPDQRTLLLWGMGTLVGVYLLKSIYLSFVTWIKLRVMYSVRVNMSKRLYETYLGQPWIFHLQRNSSKLIRNVLTETHQLMQTVLLTSIDLFTEIVLIVSILTLLIYFEPVGALSVAVVVGVAGGIFYLAVRHKVRRWGLERQQHEALTIQHLQQGLNGAKDVKLHGREKEFLDKYLHHLQVTVRRVRQQGVLSEMPRLWLEFLAVTGLSVLIISIVLQGQQMSAILHTLGLFGAVAVRLMPSINKILASMQQLRFGSAVAENIYRELHLPKPVHDTATQLEDIPFVRKIECAGLNFMYPDTDEPVLKQLSVEIGKGEAVGFVGQSGSGKSTLIDLILGVLEPAEGKILVDGVDIKLGMRAWQRMIGYVPQTIYLTDDTLRRNVAFGVPDEKIDDAAVMRALEASQLIDFFETLPEGLETIVGELGMRLSGGQRQRIGIARALYNDPEVLILDEATSALDTQTERGVMETVEALQGSKTVLIVAHRLSTVAGCNRIYRLHQGEVVDEGSSQSVLANMDQLPPAKVG